ncbi:hypothetical protein CIL05_10690 [Virgibacillus profundi]|uniref:RsgI N-terminal anti-sigma domain-containing protein n=1 Tax=Virgibacillus profundi TaxID=2024555 RepID=A0A2A2ICT3_9BACI|nr:hypothetical protein [Virgibacillus profundi]PAV29821.1 hypothetical protein CIL05_10690 [Virgibacillus profundi]PXY53992.1 hypothetical protein CIT14_10790 [Virgibacillus profundi]
MNKGIVMEKHKQFTIIMTKEGIFLKAIPIEHAQVGSEVVYEPLVYKKKAAFLFFPSKKMNAPVRLLSMVCILLLLALPFYFAMGKSNTYAYVNIDINPSIELEVNDELNVLSIRALNDDADLIVKQLTDYENEKMETVIEKIMAESEETGLINDSKNMLIGVSYTAEKKEELSVHKNIEHFFQKNNSEWEIATFDVPENIREQAEKNKKSMNEVMATTIIGKEKTPEDNKTWEASMNDEDRAIINSFYNTDKNHSESKSTDKETIKITPKKSNENQKENNSMIKERPKVDKVKKDITESKSIKEKSHPSELKKKNGEINSNGKNKGKNKNSNESKNNGKSEKHHKQKNKQSNNNGNDKNKGNNGNGNKHKKDNGKHKNSGNNGNNGKGNNGNNGKGNNGNGNNGNNGHGNNGNNGNGNNGRH